jgi:flagellar protein FlgJ
MNIVNNVNNVDSKNIDTLKRMTKNTEFTEKQLEKLKKACADFESIFYNIMFQNARKSIGNEGIVKKSQAEEIFTDMMDSEISKQIAYRSENGIKDMLFSYLTKSMNIDKDSKNIKIDIRG